MKVLGILIFAIATVAVSARHRKEWQRVDLSKISRERLHVFFKSNEPACTRGAGFYRDPTDCHQFIRCVDEFGNGRHFNVYAGRCEPGLVFDENVSACNWPELAAPCSNSPERLQETRKPLRPEQDEQNNIVSDEQNWDNSYQQQKQVIQVPQESDFSESQQEKILPVVQVFQIAAEEPSYKDKIHQTVSEEQIFEEPVQSPKQVFQVNFKEPVKQQQNFEQFQVLQEASEEEIQPVPDSFQGVINSQQKQTAFEESNDRNNEGNTDSTRQQVQSVGFQEIVDVENQKFDKSPNVQQQVPQQETQSQWWVPENNAQNNPPDLADQIQTSDVQEPVFCSEEGFFRHPENCSQFIRCVKIERNAFAVHFFECPKQLVFSDKDSSCIVADIHSCRSNIRKKRQASNTKLQCRSEGFFRHPEDCRSFYRCVQTQTGSYETHLFSCPANLVFDEEYTTCNWPEKAPPCDSQAQGLTRKPAPKEQKPSKPPISTASKRPMSTTKPRNDFLDKSITEEVYGKRRSTVKPKSTTQSYSENKPKCRSPGFFRNEYDCTKFVKCVKKDNRYIRYDLSCPKNFAYDDRSQRCIAQRYVTTCSKPKPPRQDDEETTKRPETTSQASSTSNPSDSENEDIVCEKEGYFRHPKDCNKFYRCVDFNGDGQEFVRYDFNCPEGLVFDEENSVCNWPDQSSPCDSESGNRGTGGDGSPGQTGEGQGTGETGGNEETGERETGEESDNNDNVSQENTSSTSSDQPVTESIGTTSSSSIDESSENQGGTGNESDKAQSENECTKEGFYRNPDDCNKFYRCVDFSGEGNEFVRYDFACPEDLVFDEANSVCNWPSDSEPCDTRSGGENEGGNNQDRGASSTTKTEEDSTKDNRDSSESSSNTGDYSTSTESSSNEKQSTSSGTDATQSSTRSSDGSTTESRRTNGGKSNGECTEEGFFRNPDDCNKFYRCVDHNGNGEEFVKYDFTCPEGLVFDEANSVCNWPDQSAPCDESNSGRGESTTAKERDGNDSSQTTSGSNDSSSGQTTTGYSSTESTTSNTEKGGSQSTDINESRSSTTERTNTPSGGDDSESTSGTTRGNSEGNQMECTEEGFFRNPDDCGKFYRCVDFNGDGQQFVRYDFDCPEGLVFDEVNSVCNWPDQSPPCETSGSTDQSGTTASERGSSSQTDTSSDQTSKSTEQSTQDSTYSTESSSEITTQGSTEQSTSQRSTTGDSSECSEPGFYRCKDDCSKFYRCVNENGKLVRYDFKCPDGLIFDDQNKKCDWPSSELTCDTDYSTSSTTSTYESSTTAASTSQQTTQSATSSSSSTTSSSTSSSTECTEEGFFRNPDDCSKYYRCMDEGDGTLKREDYSCAEDEVFDEEMRYCNRKDLAPPCDGTETTSSQSQSTSSTERTTSSQTASQSTTKSSGASDCTEEGYFRNPDDCSKYYRCIDEGDGTLKREDFACAENEVFDEEMRYCNRKDLAPPCDGSDTTSSQSQSTTSQYETTTAAASSQGTTERTSSTQTSTKSTTKSGEKSDCTEPGFFRCPEDCTKFYRCVEESNDSETLVRYDFQCPDGLIFDERNSKCDWPSSELTCDTDSSTSSTYTTQSSTAGSQTSDATSSDSTSSGTKSQPEECTEEGFFRNPEDCSKYYRCIDEGDGTLKREDFACAEDEVFDEEMRYCNRKDLAPPCDDTGSSTTESGRGSTGQTTSSQESESTTSSSGTSSSSDTTTASDTSSKSTGSGECQEEGFHRDPNDCSKFYRCVDFRGDGQSFTRYDFDCPEGLVFDETNDVCNWPSSVPSCESSGESSGSTGGGSSTTEEKSDSSTTAEYERSTSAPNEQVSSTTRRTDGTTNNNDYESSPTGDSTSEGTTTSNDSTSSKSTTSRDGSNDNIECTEEGFFRHPEDCSKFYRCVDFAGTGESFVRYDFDCPEGLVFDEVNSVCNWPTMSPGCEAGSKGGNESNNTESTEGNSTNESTPQSTSSGSTGNSETTSAGTDSTTSGSQTTDRSASTTGTTASSSDDFHCEEEGYFKHPSDCKKYYECKRDEETGELVKIDCECPDGQVWDNEGWYCNAEELSPPCENNSSFKCKEEGFFRDPEDCTKYYQCNRTGPGENDFKSEHFQCDEGLVFDESGRYCNAPELSDPCDESSSTSSTNTDGRSSTSSSSTDDNSSTSSGSSTDDSGSSESSNQGECTREGFFRHPEDCTKYYQCSRNENTGEFDRTDYTCSDGRIFDEGPSYCNDPQLSEEPCETSTTGESTSQQTTRTDSSSSSGSSPSTQTRGSGGNPQCNQEGFFRHPDDCNKFYRCVDFSGSGESFVRYDFDCPEGLHFDEVNSVCNWPTMTPPCESSNRRLLK